MPPLLIQGFDACVDCCVWVGRNHRPLRLTGRAALMRYHWTVVQYHDGSVGELCRAVLGHRAVPTRRKYIHVGSRSPSMATRRSAQPCTPERPANSEPLEIKPAAARCRCRCVGTPLIRPFDAMDGINEPPGMGSRRVVAGAYQRRGLHGLTSTRHDTCPVIHRAMSHKKIAHGANRWAIKEPALDPGRTAHFQTLHVQN